MRMKKNKTYTLKELEEMKNIKIEDIPVMKRFTKADKIRIKKIGQRLVHPVKEKDFVDYLKYLADK